MEKIEVPELQHAECGSDVWEAWMIAGQCMHEAARGTAGAGISLCAGRVSACSRCVSLICRNLQYGAQEYGRQRRGRQRHEIALR